MNTNIRDASFQYCFVGWDLRTITLLITMTHYIKVNSIIQHHKLVTVNAPWNPLWSLQHSWSTIHPVYSKLCKLRKKSFKFQQKKIIFAAFCPENLQELSCFSYIWFTCTKTFIIQIFYDALKSPFECPCYMLKDLNCLPILNFGLASFAVLCEFFFWVILRLFNNWKQVLIQQDFCRAAFI